MTPWTAAHQAASLSITNTQSLLKFMSIESVVPFHHLILCHPLLVLPSIFPSIKVFSDESVICTRWPKYWSFSFSTSPSNEYSALISFRMDWFGLLGVQGTLRSLLQHHSSKPSILWCLAFFMSEFHISPGGQKLKRGRWGRFLLEAAEWAGAISLLLPAPRGRLSTCPHPGSESPFPASSLRGPRLFKNG